MKKILFAAALAAFPAVATAQQVVTVSVEGTATGLDLWNNQSETRIRVGNAPELHFMFLPGDTPGIVALRIAAGLAAQGIGASAAGASVHIVTDQNGAPLRDGVDFGTNDTGHGGIAIAIDGTAAAQDEKVSGCSLPLVTPGAVGAAAFGGVILIDAEVVRPAGVIIAHSVQVPFAAGQSVDSINHAVFLALAADGLRPRVVANLMPSIINQIGNEHLANQIDTDIDGYPVRSIRYRSGIQFDMRWMEVHAGRVPTFGNLDYGRARQSAAEQPLILESPNLNHPGGEIVVNVATRQANRFCILFQGFAKAALPIPFIRPDAVLYVDPLAAMLVYGIADGVGIFEFRAPVPPQPALIGLEVFWQGGDLDPLGALQSMRLSPGFTTRLWP